MKQIKLGYEIATGEEISIKESHLVVTGITQESGKTTTLEALIDRSKARAIIFRTKPGERGITKGTKIMPYFKEDFDWEYAVELLEASRKEKLRFERSWIIKYSKNANNLIEFKSNIDQAIAKHNNGEKKLNSLTESVLVSLQAYLDKILPELQYSPLSSTLDLHEGVNIMDLEKLREETQALIIKSVLDEVLRNWKNVIVVIPEAWKYLPQQLGNPVKRPAEKFIRQGATNENYLWIDSQDITGVEKTILKQVSTWILGYQREINEIQRTLDQIPLTKKQKPSKEEIAKLKIGHFFVATKEFTKKVYVQPSWLVDTIAIDIALGNTKLDEIERPVQQINPIDVQVFEPKQEQYKTIKEPENNIKADLQAEINEVRTDFFNKINELNLAIKNLYEKMYNIPSQSIDENTMIAKVLQKIPVSNGFSDKPISIDEEALIKKVLARVPKSAGSVTYEVAPLEKIKKDFLQEAKDRMINDISGVSDDAKRFLKYLEAKGVGVSTNEAVYHCFNYNSDGGSQRKKVLEASRELQSLDIVKFDKAGKHYTELKNKIKTYVGNIEATQEEIDQVYNHILAELLGG